MSDEIDNRQDAVNTEKTLRENADRALTDKITQEILDRTNACNALTQNLNSEISTRTAQITSLTNKDTELLNKINQEVSTLTSAINQERQDRQNALEQAIVLSKGENGFVKLQGGLIIAWGIVEDVDFTNVGHVKFPTNAEFNRIYTVNVTGAVVPTSGGVGNRDYFPMLTNIKATGFDYDMITSYNPGETYENGYFFMWQAIGV